MPEETPVSQPKFEAVAREADMDLLAGEILKHKESPEFRGGSDMEIVKNVLRTIGPVPTPQSPAASGNASPYIPKYAADAPAATKLEIEQLVQMALSEGIAKANSTAAGSSPFVLDAFHDALSGALYPELQRRKLVK